MSMLGAALIAVAVQLVTKCLLLSLRIVEGSHDARRDALSASIIEIPVRDVTCPNETIAPSHCRCSRSNPDLIPTPELQE